MPAQYSYHKLIVYQKAKQLVIFVYKITKSFPSHELHGLISQIRRAAVSIPANIVEGYIKSSTKDFIRFLDISLGSLAELDFHFDLSFDLGYLNQQILDEYLDRSLEITRLLRSFQKSLRAKL